MRVLSDEQIKAYNGHKICWKNERIHVPKRGRIFYLILAVMV
jgi:hypothetical protein